MAKLPLVILALCVAGPLSAEVLRMPEDNGRAAPAALPHKGETMQAVLRQFGQPQFKHLPAGGDSPRHPPITRWDYTGFLVFFEHTHVVDAVVPDHPPPVYHAEKLRPEQG